MPLRFADHLIFRPSDLFRFAVIPLRVRLCLRFFIHFARIVFLEKVSASIFWLAFIVCWDLFANSPLNQFPLSNTMALFMTGYLTLINCRNLVYQEFAPFLSNTITQFYHCHAWDWMKPLQWLYVAAISKKGNIYFLFTLICFSGFIIIPSFWGIAYNIS